MAEGKLTMRLYTGRPKLITRLYWAARAQGLVWLAARLVYAAKVRIGWYQYRLPSHLWSTEPAGQFSRHRFFPLPGPSQEDVVDEAERTLQGVYFLFSRHSFQSTFPPSWFGDLPRSLPHASELHWSRIPDFGSFDIKRVWEFNRFSFVFSLVRAYVATKDERFAAAFWEAILDWRQKNRPQCGPNWKCGQEIAFRLICWLFGYHGFFHSPHTTPYRSTVLAEMVQASAERISGNLGYAIRQKNNHGVSEAAGVFTAGIALGRKDWIDLGRVLMTQLAMQLIYEDGSFSQHSTNYHRVMLHVYMWAIQLGRWNGIEFCPEVLQRLGAAGRWLLAMMERDTGRVPNLGANDGALVLPLSNCDYRDYRPTVQAIGMVLEDRKWLPEGPWDELATWLGVQGSTAASHGEREGWYAFPDGGYTVFRSGRTMALFRCPTRFRHRPAHCDLLHFDLWHGGTNILRDSGTYSYNCEEPWQSYFASTSAHNTVEFDGHDQMPKLSRFLFGKWPTLKVDEGLLSPSPTVTAEFTDWRGCRHCRRVIAVPHGFRVVDRIRGFRKEAVLRWRLAPEWSWSLHGNECRSDTCTIRLKVKSGPAEMQLAKGWESLYYLEKTEIPVLQVRVGPGCHEVISEITLPGDGNPFFGLDANSVNRG